MTATVHVHASHHDNNRRALVDELRELLLALPDEQCRQAIAAAVDVLRPPAPPRQAKP